jgi:hypothetical protein
MKEITQMSTQRRRSMMNEIDSVMRSYGISDNGIADFWDTAALGVEMHAKAILNTCWEV